MNWCAVVDFLSEAAHKKLFAVLVFFSSLLRVLCVLLFFSYFLVGKIARVIFICLCCLQKIFIFSQIFYGKSETFIYVKCQY